MPERLVDVLNSNNAVLHTFPITLGESGIAPQDADYEGKASRAAAHAHLVPDAKLNSLTTQMHVGRGGALLRMAMISISMSQTKLGLDQIVRERAYLLWE